MSYKTKAVKSPTTLDIAWAAGIWEGEGWCGKPTDSYRVSVVQKDTWLLYKLKDLFGGSITVPRPKTNCSEWRIFGPRAHGFLLTIFTFLSPRRRVQVRKMLAK